MIRGLPKIPEGPEACNQIADNMFIFRPGPFTREEPILAKNRLCHQGYKERPAGAYPASKARPEPHGAGGILKLSLGGAAKQPTYRADGPRDLWIQPSDWTRGIARVHLGRENP